MKHRKAPTLWMVLWVPLILLAPGLETDAQGSAPVGESRNAEYVGEEMCLACHEDYQLTPRQIHARIESFEVRGHETGCEGCHGPGSAHVEDNDPSSIVRFAAGGRGDEACMECHLTKGLSEWHASTHAAENVGCTDCHSIHPPKTAEARLAPQDRCRSCHGDVVAKFQLPSHHPVREGKLDCADCHDVHNSREGLLRTAMRPNDLCYSCHQDKEGPFIFEHEPVAEDCRTCHEPHGTTANNLLVANEPALCLQCHEFHFHAGYRAGDDDEVEVGGREFENPFGSPGMNIAFTTSCTRCHSKVHGSDLPSQTVAGGGRGLTH